MSEEQNTSVEVIDDSIHHRMIQLRQEYTPYGYSIGVDMLLAKFDAADVIIQNVHTQNDDHPVMVISLTHQQMRDLIAAYDQYQKDRESEYAPASPLSEDEALGGDLDEHPF